MSARKSQLPPFQWIVNGDMSGNVTSTPVNIEYQDNLSIITTFTGTPTGTFDLQVSHDNITYSSLPLSSQGVASGQAGTIVMAINQAPQPWVRLVYTRTGSIGTLNSTISGKQV